MNLLHVDSSILRDNSVSRMISAAVVARMQALHGDALHVARRDLEENPLPHLAGSHLGDLAKGGEVLDEFMAADIVVVGCPMYNFSVPSQLKSWIDRIAVAGKTFRYSENGPVGLATGKRVVLAMSRGGNYGPGTRAAPAEHAESYLKAVFSFAGSPVAQSIVAEGIGLGPEQRQRALDAALAEAAQLS